MAKELQADAPTGSTVYAQVRRKSDGKIWNTAGTPAFENYATANIADYDVATTEAGTASGYYTGDFPTAIGAGTYEVIYFIRSGGSPAETDTKVSADDIHWSGTAPLGLNLIPTVTTVTTTTTATNVTTVNGLAAGVITAASIAADAITDAKVASDVTIASVTGAVGSVTGNVGGNVIGSVGSVASGGITAASLAADCITAAKIADAAIDTATFAGGTTIPRCTLVDTVTAVTGLTASNLDATVSSRSTLTQAQVTGGAYSIQSASAVLGDARIANLDAAVSTRGTSTLTQTQVTGGAYTIQSSSCVLGDARIANLDAAVTTRMATYTQPTGFLAATFPAAVASTTNITAASGVTISGTTTTLDGLQTALNSTHGAGSWATATGFSTLDAAGVRTAVGLASANLDTQLDALPTAAENAAGLLDLAAGVETGLTVRQAYRLLVAANGCKISGADTTTVSIRDFADSKNRIVATVDGYGNRTAITRDLT